MVYIFSPSAYTQPFTDTTSNRTLIFRPHRRFHIDRATGYPYNQYRAQRRTIDNLPCGFKYASADVPEFSGTLTIEANDSNADGFSGRLAGGGCRAEIFGNRRYGSGYPNATTEGVEGRGFPFFFQPITYGQRPGYGSSRIYENEYGEPDKKRRPGGPLHFITIQPPKSLTLGPYPEIPPMSLYVIADKPTLDAVKSAVQWTCPMSDFSGWVFAEKVRVTKPRRFLGPARDPKGPAPEQAVGYYRGSSAVLLLAGYNNTAQIADSNLQDLEDSPLPSVANTVFFQCINATIGQSIPLVIGMGAVANAAPPVAVSPWTTSTVALVMVIFRIFF